MPCSLIMAYRGLEEENLDQIIFLQQLKRAVASKNATYLNMSQDKFEFNGSRVCLFIYLFMYLFVCLFV
jgi:hypothetical protein